MSERGTALVGCSGWSYREWRGPIYPADLPARRWFEHYAATFRTVELNTTFYRLPSEHAVDGWRSQAPPGFRFSAKVGAFGSHRKKLRDAESWLPRHVERITGLAANLGPNLLQLPPRWKRNTERLDQFLAAAPADMRWAVELRDPTWLHDATYHVLRSHGAALCIHDLLPDHPWILTADWTYLRFHGPDAQHHPYAGRYTGRRLRPVADRLGEWLDDGHDVFAYFNNDQGAAAWPDARWLADAVDGGWPSGHRGTGPPHQREEHLMPSKSAVKNENQYEALKDKGMSKERAAKIANSPDASKNGGKQSGKGGNPKQGGTTAQKKEAGHKGGKATAKKKSK